MVKNASTHSSDTSARSKAPLVLWAVLALLIGAGCVGAMLWPRDIPVYGYEVAERLEHDSGAFTQGLLFHDGFLYESTGKYGRSKLRQLDPKNGAIVREADVPSDFFAEGLARVGDRLFQLTWKAGLARVYKLADFTLLEEKRYDGEGWGLTYDGTHLILSDGTDTLRFLEPDTFKVVRRLKVTADGNPLTQINELELVDSTLWANIWKSDRIARIDLESGAVKSWVDLKGLHPFRNDADDVLNGIAHDPDTGRIWVSGKRWSRLYRVSITDDSASE